MSQDQQSPLQAGLFGEGSLISQPTDEARISQIRDLIRLYDFQYYVQDAPTVSDNEYDGLFRELQALEAKHPN